MPPLGLKLRHVPHIPQWAVKELERYADGTASVALHRMVTCSDPHTDDDGIPKEIQTRVADLNGRKSTLREAIEWIREGVDKEDEHVFIQVDAEDGGRRDRQWITCTIIDDNGFRHLRLLRFQYA